MHRHPRPAPESTSLSLAAIVTTPMRVDEPEISLPVVGGDRHKVIPPADNDYFCTRKGPRSKAVMLKIFSVGNGFARAARSRKPLDHAFPNRFDNAADHVKISS
ncbi:MAG: hypothetical protein WBJ16_06465 [Smithellaceae bacterium]